MKVLQSILEYKICMEETTWTFIVLFICLLYVFSKLIIEMRYDTVMIHSPKRDECSSCN